MKAGRSSLTALAVTGFRAAEATRSKPLLVDPYAATFLPPLLRGPLTRRLGHLALAPTGIATSVVLRHRAIDDGLRAAAPSEILVLGAGFDARAWRLARPDLHVTEIDHPATSQRKARLAAGLPPVPLTRLTCDFTTEHLADVLAAANWPGTEPAAIVWEGVTMYLDETAVVSTLVTLRARVRPGTPLWLDGWDAAGEGGWERAVVHLVGEPLTLSLNPTDLARLGTASGWRLVEALTTEALAARYGTTRRVHRALWLARLEAA